MYDNHPWVRMMNYDHPYIHICLEIKSLFEEYRVCCEKIREIAIRYGEDVLENPAAILVYDERPAYEEYRDLMDQREVIEKKVEEVFNRFDKEKWKEDEKLDFNFDPEAFEKRMQKMREEACNDNEGIDS